MSRLRAKCPDCKTHTAVAIGPEYECHSCGREFAAGLVRVPRAWGRKDWGDGGKGMAEAATALDLPYPEAAVVAEDTLADQVLVLASELPERPLSSAGAAARTSVRSRGSPPATSGSRSSGSTRTAT